MTPIWFAILMLETKLQSSETAMTWFKRLGNLGVFLGAITVSFSADWSVTIWPFFFYSFGNFIWLLVAWRFMRDRALIEMNIFFLLVNGYGIFVRL